MKPLTLLCLLAGCLFATTGASQEVKKDNVTYDMGHLEKTYGIKFKAAKLQQQKTGGDTLITVTLVFTKDLPELKIAELGKGTVRNVLPVRELFAGKNWNGSQLRCCFFDEDGVAFTKQAPGKIEGEVSGKEGDAFRVTQSVPSDVLAKTKKVSFREERAKK